MNETSYPTQGSSADLCHLFVDEAGTPDIFDAKGRINIGQPGFSRGGADAWQTVVTNPRETICLQAADYFLWALQRFYEPRVHAETGEVTHEARYLNAIWPQVSQIHDLHFGPSHGTFFTPANHLNLNARFGSKPQKRKKPHV